MYDPRGDICSWCFGRRKCLITRKMDRFIACFIGRRAHMALDGIPVRGGAAETTVDAGLLLRVGVSSQGCNPAQRQNTLIVLYSCFRCWRARKLTEFLYNENNSRKYIYLRTGKSGRQKSMYTHARTFAAEFAAVTGTSRKTRSQR